MDGGCVIRFPDAKRRRSLRLRRMSRTMHNRALAVLLETLAKMLDAAAEPAANAAQPATEENRHVAHSAVH